VKIVLVWSLDRFARELLDRKSIDSERDHRQSPFLTMFSDTGPGRRELYPKQIEFFGAGQQYKE
jgi:hypothetical protein